MKSGSDISKSKSLQSQTMTLTWCNRPHGRSIRLPAVTRSHRLLGGGEFTLLPILACFALATLNAETPQVPPPLRAPRPGFAFPAKQTLNYAVDWRVFPAGVVAFHLEADGDQQRVAVTADTVGAVNLLFRVSDRFQSSFNRGTGCSAGFSKQIIEGRRQVNSDLKFNYAVSKGEYTEKNLVSGISKRQEVAIPSCVTDSLSAIFYASSQPMTVGQSFQMS